MVVRDDPNVLTNSTVFTDYQPARASNAKIPSCRTAVPHFHSALNPAAPSNANTGPFDARKSQGNIDRQKRDMRVELHTVYLQDPVC